MRSPQVFWHTFQNCFYLLNQKTSKACNPFSNAEISHSWRHVLFKLIWYMQSQNLLRLQKKSRSTLVHLQKKSESKINLPFMNPWLEMLINQIHVCCQAKIWYMSIVIWCLYSSRSHRLFLLGKLYCLFPMTWKNNIVKNYVKIFYSSFRFSPIVKNYYFLSTFT